MANHFLSRELMTLGKAVESALLKDQESAYEASKLFTQVLENGKLSNEPWFHANATINSIGNMADDYLDAICHNFLGIGGVPGSHTMTIAEARGLLLSAIPVLLEVKEITDPKILAWANPNFVNKA